MKKYTFVVIGNNGNEIKKTHNMKIALNAYREGYFVKIYTPCSVVDNSGKTVVKQLLTAQWSDGREFVGVEA